MRLFFGFISGLGELSSQSTLALAYVKPQSAASTECEARSARMRGARNTCGACRLSGPIRCRATVSRHLPVLRSGLSDPRRAGSSKAFDRRLRPRARCRTFGVPTRLAAAWIKPCAWLQRACRRYACGGNPAPKGGCIPRLPKCRGYHFGRDRYPKSCSLEFLGRCSRCRGWRGAGAFVMAGSGWGLVGWGLVIEWLGRSRRRSRGWR